LAQTRIDRRTNYASPAILARRARILELARELVAEQGYAGFSMKELGARAGVAKQTLYNIFQTKERLIASAITALFEINEAAVDYHSAPGTMERMIERTLAVWTLSNPTANYMNAIMAIYHSPDAAPDIWNTIHAVGSYSHAAWIESLAASDMLQPWVDAQTLIDELVAYRYAIMLAWCQQRLDADEMVRRLVIGSLCMVSGSTRDSARSEVERRLAEITANGLPPYGEHAHPPTRAAES
jgi:AcrR family transcriptional regulator